MEEEGEEEGLEKSGKKDKGEGKRRREERKKEEGGGKVRR